MERKRLIIDSNGIGWFYNDQGECHVGPIRGPEGPAGPPGNDGTDGNDGAAATISVANTITGEPGTSASVINVGSTSAAEFVFTIPKGEPGEGKVTKVTGVYPINVINTTTEPAISIQLHRLQDLPTYTE